MKLLKHVSICWLSRQLFVKELQVKWLIWKQRWGEKKAQHCLKELQSVQIADDDFEDWIQLIRAMNPEIPENIFLGEKK